MIIEKNSILYSPSPNCRVDVIQYIESMSEIRTFLFTLIEQKSVKNNFDLMVFFVIYYSLLDLLP